MVLTRAALEPAHNNSCGPLLKEKSGHPWPRQNRETNATPQSSQVASPNVSLTRLKRYRYCLNHTHTHTHTHTQKLLSLHSKVSREAVSSTEPSLYYSKYTNCLNLDSTWQPEVPEEEQNTQPAHHVFGFPFVQCSFSLYDG